jgi:hypothetical protein
LNLDLGTIIIFVDWRTDPPRYTYWNDVNNTPEQMSLFAKYLREYDKHHVPKDGISILIAQQPTTYLVFPNKVYLYFYKIINAIFS